MTALDLRAEWTKRPWWMNLILGFCLFMTFGYLPFDMFWKPVATDQEVWFGFLLEGWAAKLTEPVHWAIYAAGAYGLWKMRSWMWPWAAAYSLQVAISMLVWSLMRGSLAAGGVAFAVFMIPTIALYRARERFRSVTR
ncbi:MAG: hypothetical protein MK365_15795 [Vicinamibacterales bacterium]|jgi:hypothetical protein|nr:hypothetical protein [Vicinamibacterales bacterium]